MSFFLCSTKERIGKGAIDREAFKKICPKLTSLVLSEAKEKEKEKGTPGGVTYGTETGLRPVLYRQKSVKVGVGGPEVQQHESELGHSPNAFEV